MARRGAREVGHRDPDGGQRSAFFSDEQERRRRTPPPSRQPKWERLDGARDEWEESTPPAPQEKSPVVEEARVRDRSRPARAASTAGALAALSNRVSLPPEVATDIRNAADTATAHHRERLVERAEAAYGAYERGRFSDALRAIKPVADEAPAVAAVRELAGLAAYRTGRWRDAACHLQAFGTLSDSTEHLPVLMDCQRALHKPKKVAELWAELRHSSPEPDVLAEGRIVAAASLADAGDFQGAIAMLATAGASKTLRNPSDRHIRQWYVLGDLYERAGDIPRARDFFDRVLRADPDAYDVAQRLRGLGPERKRPRPKSPGRAKSTPAPAARAGRQSERLRPPPPPPPPPAPMAGREADAVDERLSQAAANNAHWCRTMCAAHGMASTFFDDYWLLEAGSTLPLYPNLVTLAGGGDRRAARVHRATSALRGRPVVRQGQLQPARPPSHGLRRALRRRVVLSAARCACAPRKRERRRTRWGEPVTGQRVESVAELRAWETAWAQRPRDWSFGDCVFPPALLQDERIAFLFTGGDAGIRAGLVANYHAGVVGLSNAFARSGQVSDLVGCLRLATTLWPGLPLVGYGTGPELEGLERLGFERTGPCRIWQRGIRRLTSEHPASTSDIAKGRA